MLIELHEEGWEEFHAVLKQALELTDWDIELIFFNTLDLLTPLRYEKKVVAEFSEQYESKIYKRILSVSKTIQLEWSHNRRATEIRSRDIKAILPFTDKIVDAVIRNKDEVRELLHLMQEFDDLPKTVDVNEFAGTHELYNISIDIHGGPIRSSIKRMDIEIHRPEQLIITLDNHEHPMYIQMRYGPSVSQDWMFMAYNLPALIDVYKKFIDWYSKTFEKQMKIRDAMLKIKKTMDIEKRLLQ